MPISHLWGPVRLYYGENQYTGGPGYTLSWENIALLEPEALAERIENIRHTLQRYHNIGIGEIVPYISYHTIAGDHKKRLGFWKFYDNWNKYSRWAGPRPENDPFEWLVVDRHGKFVGGSCGGYSPEYFAPLHRYRACINHPDWAEWQCRLIRMIAEVGYDGCFIDNTHPDSCYCSHCKALFRKFIAENNSIDWVRDLIAQLSDDQLQLDSKDVPPELVRRWRLISTGEHMHILRETGRQINPNFTIFPNSGRINDCLTAGRRCDYLMFENSSPAGMTIPFDPQQPKDISVTVSDSSTTSKPYRYAVNIHDESAWVELSAILTASSTAQIGKPIEFKLEIISIGASKRDGDFAKDFHISLCEETLEEEVRVKLEPTSTVTCDGTWDEQPTILTGTWAPQKTGHYNINLGFTYSDPGHSLKIPYEFNLFPDQACQTHMVELLFTQHMHAKPIYLCYAYKKNSEYTAELNLAEFAAFSGGGGVTASGLAKTKYRKFFKKHLDLFVGWQQTAPTAVLFSRWGRNYLSHAHICSSHTIANRLAINHHPFVALIDATLPESSTCLTKYKAICLDTPTYEMASSQFQALNDYVKQGGSLFFANGQITINGRSVSDIFNLSRNKPAAKMGHGRISIAQWKNPPLHTPPVTSSDGVRRNMRFALYYKGNSLALHAVNYNVDIFGTEASMTEVDPLPITLPVPKSWTKAKVTCFDPDNDPQELRCRIENNTVHFIMPITHIYKIVLLEKTS